MLLSTARPSSSGLVRKEASSKPQSLLGDLRVKGPRREQHNTAEAPGCTRTNQGSYTVTLWSKNERFKATGHTWRNHIQFSAGELWCRDRAHAHAHWQQAGPCFVCKWERNAINNPPRVAQNHLGGLYNTVCTFPSPLLFSLLPSSLFSPCLVLFFPPLRLLPLHPPRARWTL